MNIGMKATLVYAIMTFGGIFISKLTMIYLNPSLDFFSVDVPKIIFGAGSFISIIGLHEVFHCLYCQIRGVKIVRIIGGLKDIGIIVVEPHPAGVHLSSFISIPIVAIVSVLIDLPLWIVICNIGLACIYCIDDLIEFLKH